MIGEIKKRIAVAFDYSKPCELRVFAWLELFCFPVSMITVMLIPVLLMNRYWWGYSIPLGMNVCIKILLAAATGYITNYIAVEMLFKPYHESKRHALSLLTFGYWSQGLIPRNKSKIGKQLGSEAETLIAPDQIANDLCRMVAGLLDDEKNLSSIECTIRDFLSSKEEQIVSTCLPEIEEMCTRKINEFVTSERVKLLWVDVIKPHLKSEDTKEIIVRQFASYINAKVPDLMPSLKEEVRGLIYDFLQRNEVFQSIAAAAMFVAAREWKLTQFPAVATMLRLGGGILLFALVHIEIANYFSGGEGLHFHLCGELTEAAAYTIAWAFCGAICMFLSNRKAPWLLQIGIGLIGLAVFKLFMADYWQLSGIPKIIVLVGVAMIMLGVSFVYQQLSLRTKTK